MRSTLAIAFAASLYLFAQSAPPDFAVAADVVLVSVTALDGKGNFVADLRAEDFVLEDNGKPRAIEHMWREDSTPLTIGLIADTSGSQRQVIPNHQRALAQFLQQVLRAQDQAFLMSIPSDVRMTVDVTHSVKDLQDGVGGLHLNNELPSFGEPCLYLNLPPRGLMQVCNTALWGAIHDAAMLRMREIQGRKAFIVLSDGIDNGSKPTLSDAIAAAQRSGVVVYTILTEGIDRSRRAQENLARLAAETGGRAYRASDEKGSKKIFDEIEVELRNAYILAFSRPPDVDAGAFHQLKITSTRRGVTIRTRAGYFADR